MLLISIVFTLYAMLKLMIIDEALCCMELEQSRVRKRGKGFLSPVRMDRWDSEWKSALNEYILSSGRRWQYLINL